MTEEKKEESGGVSRREFLRDAGLLVGGTAIGSAVLLGACGGETETVTSTKTVTKTVEVSDGTAENIINLTVNGMKHTIQIQPNWTLHYVLHDKLGWIGPKTFCERGACGSCTVIMAGRPILSCMTLAIDCDGQTIETSEGIAQSNHPLIEAYIKYHCMQCGYCTPGFVVTAKALLDRNPNPTEDEVREALAGNLCRCATYPAHQRAVLEAAKKL